MNEEKQTFSPRRVAWVTAMLSVLLIPCHFFVSCDLSGRLAMSGIGLVFITGFFSLADKTGKKALPFGLAVVGLIGHTLCTH
jgi:hypothetical protein